jgi:hypothetical protein
MKKTAQLVSNEEVYYSLPMLLSYDIYQAVSRLPLIRMSYFAPGCAHVDFVVGKVALGQVFSEFFGYSLSLYYTGILHAHVSSE